MHTPMHKETQWHTNMQVHKGAHAQVDVVHVCLCGHTGVLHGSSYTGAQEVLKEQHPI